MNTIDLKVKKYKIERVLQDEFIFKLPTKPLFLFQYGIRRSIKIIPQWTNWNKENGKDEEIWRLDFVIVKGSFENSINKIEIQTSRIEDSYMIGKGDYYDLLEITNNYSERNIRTEEEFNKDFENVLNNLRCFLNF